MYYNLPNNVVKKIREEVEKIKKEYQIINPLVRTDIFDILDKLCVVLRYPLVKKLVNEHKLTIIKYEDFLDDPDDPYYSSLFADLYRYCNERELNYGKANFRTYQEAEANLGEIHSVILALYTGYPLFFSNDKGSKTMAKTKINTSRYRLEVRNIMDVFDEIAVMETKSLTKKDFVNLTKGDNGRKVQVQEIKGKWVE